MPAVKKKAAKPTKKPVKKVVKKATKQKVTGPLKVNRAQLLQVLEFVSPGLSTREVIEQSNYYCFKDGKVFTYDDETAVISDSPLGQDFTGAIPSAPLREILHKLKEEYIEVTLEEGRLSIQGKGQSMKILMAAKIELPIDNLETPKKWKKLPESFTEGLKLVEGCASKDESNFALTCINVTSKFIEAYDRDQFARFNVKLDVKKEHRIKQVSLKNIINLEMSEFAETPKWFHFRNSTGLVLSCRRFGDKYPVLDVLAQSSGEKLEFPKSLGEIAERAEVFSAYNVNKNEIVIDLKPNWVHVTGTGQYGEYKGKKKIKYSGEELGFVISPKLLQELVKKHSECQLCTNNVKALKIEVGNFVFVASLNDPSVLKDKVKSNVQD